MVVYSRIDSQALDAPSASVYLAFDRNMPLAREFHATTADIIRQRPGATELKRGLVTQGVIRGSEVILDLPTAKTGKVRHTSLTT